MINEQDKFHALMSFLYSSQIFLRRINKFDPRHEIFNYVVYATSKGSDLPAIARSLSEPLLECLNIL